MTGREDLVVRDVKPGANVGIVIVHADNQLADDAEREIRGVDHANTKVNLPLDPICNGAQRARRVRGKDGHVLERAILRGRDEADHFLSPRASLLSLGADKAGTHVGRHKTNTLS